MSIPRFFVNLCILIALLPAHIQAQTAYLQSTELVEGDIAVLIVEFENEVPSLFPLDTTPLLSDFEVLQVKPALRREQTANSVVNIMRWEVELYPRKTGRLRIAPLTVRGQQTPEIILQFDSQNQYTGPRGNIFLEVSADQSTAFVDQQIILTIRLFHNRALRRGTIYDLKLDNFDIYPLGTDRRYTEVIDTENFTVLERKLVLFAREPGDLQIPAMEFRGELESDMKRRIIRYSSAINLNILPAIDNTTAEFWLPATAFEVSQQWFQKQGTLFSGDAISRKVTIRANGIGAANLPENLISQNNPSFEIYADQPQRIDSFDYSGIIGELEQTHVIVFTEPGLVEILDTEIHWWDITAAMERRIVLPGKKLTIALAESDAGSQISQQTKPILSQTEIVIVLCITTILIIVAGIIGYHGLFDVNDKAIPFSIRQLKKACYSGNARGTHQQLIYLAAKEIKDKPRPGLFDLVNASNSLQFKQQLRLLDQALYGIPPSSWQGHRLWHAYREHNRSLSSKSKEIQPQLPALYPG